MYQNNRQGIYVGFTKSRVVKVCFCSFPFITLRESVDVSNLYQFSAAKHTLSTFCEKPRARQENVDFLKIKTVTHAIKYHIMLLVERELIALRYPDRPRSPKQEYTTSQKNNKQ